MSGPGRWSVDARLFGWKRIEASPRRRFELARECRRLNDGRIWVFIEGWGWMFLEVRW
jgi:hypothetical protein